MGQFDSARFDFVFPIYNINYAVCLVSLLYLNNAPSKLEVIECLKNRW